MDEQGSAIHAHIPHLDASQLAGRFVANPIFFVNDEWNMWVPIHDGKFIKVKAWPAESTYYSHAKQEENDFHSEFIDFLAQRANVISVKKAYSGLLSDLMNLATSLDKFSFFHQHREQLGGGIKRVVVTELEYLFSVCRSVFDLLQEAISALWLGVINDDGTKTRKLKPKFSSMVEFDSKPRPRESYQEQFGLPEPLVEFYCTYAEFFLSMRKVRDNVIHNGSTLDWVYSTDQGFAVSGDQEPFSSFNIWNAEHRLPNDLCSLRPALCYIVYMTISACEDFSRTMQKCVRFPSDSVPGMQVFIRSPHTHRLNEIPTVINNCMWWV